MYDAVIIGSGPNGLAAAITLAQAGRKVLVIEKSQNPGGGMRSAALTLPGFMHDLCSAVHPMAAVSPYLTSLPLEHYGLKWAYPEVSLAHPLEGEPSVLLTNSLATTAEGLGVDTRAWLEAFGYFHKRDKDLFSELLRPLGWGSKLGLLTRFGMSGGRSAVSFIKKFEGQRASALFAGCAAHSVLPLDFAFTAAVGILFLLTGYRTNWPVAVNGSGSITKAMTELLADLGGEIRTDHYITTVKQLPESRFYLFDTDPFQLAAIAGDWLPETYKKRLRSFNYGPGVFKIDWALSGAIPWSDSTNLKASVVHLGGTADRIIKSEQDAWQGRHNEHPFVILCQQSHFDPSRSPRGMHTGYAYCHVPAGSQRDMTQVIENQVERFAPGFRSLILARHTVNTHQFQAYNPNYYGGAVTGGAASFGQLFRRPVWRANSYSTPNPRIYICSAFTPPGGGVHGMCGYWAAQAVLDKDGR